MEDDTISKITCPNCGAENDETFLFCETCGYKLKKPQPTPQTQEKEETSNDKCPRCGFENEPDANFCLNCGLKLKSNETIKETVTPEPKTILETEQKKSLQQADEQYSKDAPKSTPKPVTKPDPIPVPAPFPKESTKPEEQEKVTADKNLEDQKTEPQPQVESEKEPELETQEETKVESEVEPTNQPVDRITKKTEEKNTTPKPEKEKCPKCGFENEKGANFCLNCGYDLKTSTQAPEQPHYTPQPTTTQSTQQSVPKHKNKILSLLLAIIFIGAGAWYNGQILRGFIYFALAAIFFFIMVAYINVESIAMLGFLLLALLYILQIIDAITSANDINNGEQPRFLGTLESKI